MERLFRWSWPVTATVVAGLALAEAHCAVSFDDYPVGDLDASAQVGTGGGTGVTLLQRVAPPGAAVPPAALPAPAARVEAIPVWA